MTSGPRIAVVGMSGRFPGAQSVGEFWSNLESGRESLTTFTDEELVRAGIPRAILSHPKCVKRAPILGPIDGFDAAFFGYSGREAERLDPQQRLLLECAHEALEEAGCVPERFDGRIGVYAGVGSNGYLEPLIRGTNVVTELENVLGNDKDYAATRLSYKLGLKGPSVTVQTACSTSLVAIHLACQALLNGECDLALAGGAKVRIPQVAAYVYQEGALLSPDGRCRAFDAAADGTAFGSGAGMVALRRLEDALEAGDPIDAVILGSAINNDGAQKVGYVAPSEDGQAAVIAEALAIAGVDAGTIGYVEAHGTGTPLGDPIEVAALTRAFRECGRSPASCAIGSVKTNVGHLETAAGVAGFIKTVLALKHRTLPASLNFSRPNPHIDFARTPFRVNAQRNAWAPAKEKLRAGVSSFGIGGTNAHVVLEEAPDPKVGPRPDTRVFVLPISARSEDALRALSERYQSEILARGSDLSWLDDACAGAGLRRAHHGYRLCAAGETGGTLVESLRTEPSPRRAAAERPRVVFVYSGQGSQWIGMGRRLLREDPAFAARMEACDVALRRVADFSVLEILASDTDPRWQRVDVIQPLLFAMQVALSAAWSRAGVEPSAVLGHSLGEVAASVVAGSLSLEDGAYVIGTRSRMVRRTSGRGRMAVLELGLEEAERLCGDHPGVSIAAHNGPMSVLVSGTKAAVEALVLMLEKRGVFARLVDVDYASHSAEMDPILDELGRAMAEVKGRKTGRIIQCSTVFAEVIGGEEVGGDYWVKNLREPVRFHASVEKLLGTGHSVFLEVSPHPVLAPAIERSIGDRGLALGTLRKGGDETLELSSALSRLFAYGVEVDWARRHGKGPGRFVRLPAYPWQRRPYWIADRERQSRGADRGPHAWLVRATPNAAEPGTTIWEGDLGRKITPRLEAHRVQGAVVVAAAVWLEAAMHAAKARGSGAFIEDVELLRILELGSEDPAKVQLIDRPGGFEIMSAHDGEGWSRSARGRFGPARPLPEAIEIEAVKARSIRRMEGALFYERLRLRGVEHEGEYAALRRLWIGDGEALGELELEHADPEGWAIEPWWIDAALQVLGAAEDARDMRAYLPAHLGTAALHRRPKGTSAHVYARWRSAGEGLEGDVRAHDQEGAVWFEATGVRLRPVGRSPRPADALLFARNWALLPRGSDAAKGHVRRRLILGQGAIATQLAEGLGRSQCTLASPEGADFDEVLKRVPDCADVVYAPDPERTPESGPLEVLGLVQALARSSFRDPPRLWIVTQGAAALSGDPPARVSQAPLWGLAHTIVHEHPELRTTLVDVLGDRAMEAVVQEIHAAAPGSSGASEDEDQIALRAEGRFVARLARTHLEAAPLDLVRPAGARPFALEIGQPGRLETLALSEMVRTAPGPGEVEIEVEASGLNLLDVLIALGVLEDDAPGAEPGRVRLGGECAGVVARVGPGVEKFRAGDRVFAVAHDAFRSFAVARASLTAKIPAGMSFEQAAGFPIAFLTAHLALEKVAHLEKGERILIHAASTGVGRAAVQIAQRIGAEIFATAGTDEKRDRLRKAGVAHVMSSRSLDFVREVRAATGGRGVDVVLNSLSGDFIAQSLGLLAPHGRFVEIGKRDYYEDRRLGLEPFLKSLTFSLFDLRGLLYSRPQVVEEALAELTAALEIGALEPLAPQVFPAASAAEAMRTMAEGRHSQKIVLSMRDPKAKIAPRRTHVIRSDATYLITGGLGALGLEVAARLVERGARRIVLMGRRSPSPEAEAKIAAWMRQGAEVLIERGDVADLDDVARSVRTATSDLRAPLAGIVHAAGLLDDGILIRQDARRFRAVMAPKVTGAWNLHLATRDVALDFFVLFSSTASLLGAPGQGNYAAASAFLDALAHHRRSIGLPGLSIQFGPWGEIGLAAQGEERGARAAAQGMLSLSPKEGIDAFEALLSSGFAEVGVVRLELRQWLESHPQLAGAPLFRSLLESSSRPAASRSRFGEALAKAPEGERRTMLERHLREEAARILRTTPERIDPSASLVSLGLSSLTALEYRNRLEASLGSTFPATLIWKHPTTAELTEHVAARLGLLLEKTKPKAAEIAPTESPLEKQIDRLTEAEAEQALLDVLDGLEVDA